MRLQSGYLVEFENNKDNVVINLKQKPNELQSCSQFVDKVCKVNMETVIYEEMCSVCHYFKFHHNEMICPPKHFTSLCELYRNKYIR